MDDLRTRDREVEFKDFYMREAPRLRRLGIMLTGDVERGSDLAHDALLKTYVSWARIRNEDPSPYAKQTLVNLCRSSYRRKMLELRKTPSPASHVSDPGSRIDEALRVATALSVLSPIRRAVVLLRFYEDMTEAEIARTLDRPINTIKSDLRRAMDRLRAVLDDDIRESR
jgi:RNA polymerase sigma-70 factor (sigma-E family)